MTRLPICMARLLVGAPRVVRRLPGVLGADVPAASVSLRARAELAHGWDSHGP